MFISDLSIRRPVVATVMMLTLVTIGLFSWRRLSIDLMPDVEIPVLSITTEYPGASPETVEREVSRKIEEAVTPISGVKHVDSISREGLSTVIVEFQLEVAINDASQEARAKIASQNEEQGGKIVTTVEPASTWYPAEDYHQNYWETEGQRNPYCMAVIPPKLNKLRKSFQNRLKAQATA